MSLWHFAIALFSTPSTRKDHPCRSTLSSRPTAKLVLSTCWQVIGDPSPSDIINSMQVVVDGLKTHYLDINPQEKNTLVFLHGWKSSSKFWVPFSKLLKSTHRIILIDLPGFGSTDQFSTEPEIPLFTDFIHHFVKRLKLKNITLVGHSFGGLLALDYAIKYPADLSFLILVAPAVVKEKPSQAKRKIRFAEIARPLFTIIPNNHFEKYLGWYTPRDYRHANEYQQKILKKIVLYDLKPSLNKVTIPTNIVWGKLDFVVPNLGKYLNTKIPNSHLHVIDGSGHLCFLTHPKELSDIFNQILSD
ncbi:MAG: Alpha/beta hydrolase family protein [Candidatus Collierbacteria bacterium GW2011_GWB1_44_6]|uniref:Alpha/beta hydrolase family protein n=2 Tax=Candidatus Collieribacteriota TaxID=1752725 RepID=A0A0G1JL14_9BACT|nr:MAG: Alpha/beta hydrolase family protein [Candidatus Collierbacteria bacterium GW2011_GWC2_43_12]KKT72241.1 MAG: Alpha/beta hydrolase family protein [Candidatus Collierbacteria bacterium GW2011_GWB1_44_6]